MTKMNLEVKARWLAALRSNRFQQGVRRLHYVDDQGAHRYCCLGILCELAIIDNVIDRRRVDGFAWFAYESSQGSSSAVLPKAVVDWAGLTQPNPAVESPPNGDVVRLSHLNDARRSFAEIADVIEERL